MGIQSLEPKMPTELGALVVPVEDCKMDHPLAAEMDAHFTEWAMQSVGKNKFRGETHLHTTNDPHGKVLYDLAYAQEGTSPKEAHILGFSESPMAQARIAEQSATTKEEVIQALFPHRFIGGNLANFLATGVAINHAMSEGIPSVPMTVLLPQKSQLYRELLKLRDQSLKLLPTGCLQERQGLNLPCKNRRETLLLGSPYQSEEDIRRFVEILAEEMPTLGHLLLHDHYPEQAGDRKQYIVPSNGTLKKLATEGVKEDLYINDEELMLMYGVDLKSIIPDGAFSVENYQRSVNLIRKMWNREGEDGYVVNIGMRGSGALAIYRENNRLYGLETSLMSKQGERALAKFADVPGRLHAEPIDTVGRGDSAAAGAHFFRELSPHIIEAMLSDPEAPKLQPHQKAIAAMIAPEICARASACLVFRQEHSNLLGLPPDRLRAVFTHLHEQALQSAQQIYKPIDLEPQRFHTPYGVHGVLFAV